MMPILLTGERFCRGHRRHYSHLLRCEWHGDVCGSLIAASQKRSLQSYRAIISIDKQFPHDAPSSLNLVNRTLEHQARVIAWQKLCCEYDVDPCKFSGLFRDQGLL